MFELTEEGLPNTAKMTEEEYFQWEESWKPLDRTNSVPVYRKLNKLRAHIGELIESGQIDASGAWGLGRMLGRWEEISGQLMRTSPHPFVGDVSFVKGLGEIEMVLLPV